jgi:DNA-binding transcriptional regulator LsrR (DeoR family)
MNSIDRKKRIIPDRKKRMMYVAYLVSQGYRAKDIVQLLDGATGTQVTILTTEAARDGYLDRAPAFHREKCTPQELEELDNLDLSIQLRERLRAAAIGRGVAESHALRRIRVLPSGGWGHSQESLMRRLEYFASCVASELLARIAESSVLGVTWGTTLATAVEAVSHLDLTPLRNGGRRFIATCGEPFSMEPFLASSSHIAERLDMLQGGEGVNVSTLRGLPAFIPREFHRDVILRFIHGHTAFGRIFGYSPAERQKSAISELDTVLTSVGTLEDPPSKFVGELVAKSKRSLEYLRQLTMGDIGGALIEHPKLSPTAEKNFQHIADMWIGISAQDLAGVVARSAGTAKPGVVVLAIGKNKVNIVHECVSRGLVSQLFVDQDLAIALGHLFGLDSKPPAGAA